MASKLERAEKPVIRVSGWLNWIAVIAMVLMLLIVVIDVAGAKLFRLPVRGALELVCILGLIISGLAIPFTYVIKGHISIEFFMLRLRKSIRNPVIIIGLILSLALFVLMTWQMFTYSETIQEAGVITPSMRIPVSPFTYAVALAFLIVCFLILPQLIRKIEELIKR